VRTAHSTAVAVLVVLATTGALVSSSVAIPTRSSAAKRHQQQYSQLISLPAGSRPQQGISGLGESDLPNGASTNPVISNDQRYARLIAFESEASNLVLGDANGQKDVFAIRRVGPIGNKGSVWRPGSTILVSRTQSGQPADGPSFSAAVDGAFRHKPSCVAFLSAATNLVPGDTNARVDAFVSQGPGGPPTRVSLPGGRQSSADTTQVAVSGDCSRIAFVTGGNLYVRVKAMRPRLLAAGASDPSFSTGLRNDLVFGGARGVYLSKRGTAKPRLVGPGGRNPAYNDIDLQVVSYEKHMGGHVQIVFRDLGSRARVVSSRDGVFGDADSRKPVIGNSGFYITFESDASNLGVDALGRASDTNGKPDVYLYTETRDITLVQSVEEKAVPLPGGGQNPSMSFYANYIVFDSPASVGEAPSGDGMPNAQVQFEEGRPPVQGVEAPHQIFMRYLGPA
jgi:hypothetical protein